MSEHSLQQRVLVAAPTGRDAEVLCDMLATAGFESRNCPSMSDLCDEIGKGGAAVILADEIITRASQQNLLTALTIQPEWSDLPMIVMGMATQSKQAGWQALIDSDRCAHAILLHRPVSKATLLSSVRSAVRSRLRQYQVRDELAKRKCAEEALQASQDRLAKEAYALTRLNESSSRLWRMTSLSEGLEEMLAATIELLDADMGNIQLLKEGVLKMVVHRGFEEEFITKFQQVSVDDESASGRAVRTGQRVVIEDVEADKPYSALRPIARAANYRGVQSTPMIGRDGKPQGTISTYFREPRRPDEQDLRRLDLYVHQAVDFLERCQAEQDLRESEARYSSLMTLLPAGVYTCDADSGVITFFNDHAARLWGRAPKIGDTDEQFCGSFRLWRMDGTLLPHGETPMAVAMRDNRSFYNQEVIIERPDGSQITVLVNIEPTRDKSGRVTGAINVFHDTTELRETQQALRESEEKFRLLADHISQFAWMADEKGALFWYNQRWYDYTGTTLDEMKDWGWQAVHHPEHVDRVTKKFRRHVERGEPWEDTFPLRSKQGHYRWFLSRARPIRDSGGKIVRWFGTNTDVTELRDVQQALREADRRKNEFLATLAHELRNPMAPIRTGLEIMRRAGGQTKIVEETREMMERQTQQLITLVDDLLDVSRISQGKLHLHSCRVKLDDVFRSAVETCQPLADERQHQLTVQLPQKTVYLDGDPNRLAQILSNLINNAVKYTPDGGSIWLTAELAGEEVVISVRDTGLGIPQELCESVFEMFAQIHRPEEKGYSGLGIGLSLVKSLVTMHGGSISVTSPGAGKGSTFSVRLPVLSTVDEAPLQTVETTPLESKRIAKRRVLVVDDNDAAARTLSIVVKMLGNEVRTAGDGQEACDVAREFLPDVMLMDLGMPRMNGFEAARYIRQQPWGKTMTLVALTGWGQESDKEKSQAAGFDHHLTKPAEPAEIERLLSTEVEVH